MTSNSRVTPLLVAIAVATVSLAARQAPPVASGQMPIAVRAACVGQGAAATLRVTVANSSSREAAFVLGFIAGAEKTRAVNAVNLLAIRPATGASEDFLYMHPKYPLAPARSEPWIVTLAPGKTFDVDLPVKDFISGMNYQPLDPMAVAGSRLVVEARPAKPATAAVWTGTVETPLDECR
jgi:hypothetical protein